MSSFIFTEAQLSVRPQKGDTCFYCKAKVGQEHDYECPLRTKTARVAYTVELDIEVPECWTAHDIEFHRNESSWCADNAFNDVLKEHKKKKKLGQCWCPVFTCVCIDEGGEIK